MKEKDDRIKLLTELLNGMRFLKFYAWEGAFQGRLAAIRGLEMGWIKRNAFINGLLEFLWTSSSVMVRSTPLPS